MNRKLLFLALLVIGFASCKKDDDNEPSKPSYRIDGIVDRSMQKTVFGTPPTTTLNLNVMYEHSDQERVTLSIENVPEGLKSKFSTKSGIPGFNTSLLLIDSGVVAGEYTLKLIATGSNTGRRSYDFNLTVLAPPDCSSDLTGTGYATQTSCNPTGSFTQNITSVPGQVGRVLFSNFDNTGAQVYANVICNSGQVSIPSQTVNGVVYQGSGYYNVSGGTRYINVSYGRTVSGSTITCSMLLSL
jgi:hypothetical protein